MKNRIEKNTKALETVPGFIEVELIQWTNGYGNDEDDNFYYSIGWHWLNTSQIKSFNESDDGVEITMIGQEQGTFTYLANHRIDKVCEGIRESSARTVIQPSGF